MNYFTIKPHSAIGQAAWIDLLRLLKEAAKLEIRGKPRLKTVGGRGYWYDQYRIGDQVIDRYIGEDTEDLRTRMDQIEEARKTAKNADKERSRLLRILRAEGYLTADIGTGQIAQALARAGVFRFGGTLVGTQAFRTYEGVLGIQMGFDQSTKTNDIDVASFEKLSMVLEDRVDTDLSEVFSELKFAPQPSLKRGHTWRWLQTQRQTLVEFLTPSFNAEEGLRKLPALGVSAQSLHFLNYLIAEPITVPLLYRTGVLVQVPRPERYAIQKLIVADPRLDDTVSQKAAKDRAQAAFLIQFLAEDRPDDLAEAYQDALSIGQAWRESIDRSLDRLKSTREILGRIS